MQDAYSASSGCLNGNRQLFSTVTNRLGNRCVSGSIVRASNRHLEHEGCSLVGFDLWWPWKVLGAVIHPIQSRVLNSVRNNPVSNLRFFSLRRLACVVHSIREVRLIFGIHEWLEDSHKCHRNAVQWNLAGVVCSFVSLRQCGAVLKKITVSCFLSRGCKSFLLLLGLFSIS
jgi:hypothetical protein